MYTSVFLVLILVSCCCSNAMDLAVPQSYENNSTGKVQHVVEAGNSEKLCTLCVEFSSEAINYFSENITQENIVGILHDTCSKIPSFKKQCVVLVDYYAPLFFSEISSAQPELFCKRFDLCCDDNSISHHVSKDKCDLCHEVTAEALQKLKDPDTELDIVKLLLKACDSIGKDVQKCKKLVFEYAPIILINAAQFLEKNDVCTILRACNLSRIVSYQLSLGAQTS